MNAPAFAADVFPAAEFTGVTSDDRPAWLAMRRTMITASRTAALFGEHPFETLLDIYVDMVTERPANDVVTIHSPMFWGSALEQAILESASRYYGWKALRGGQLLRSRKHPYLGATLDGAIDRGAGWIVYEGKTTAAWRAKDWDEETGNAPTHVIIQAQHQLLVTGAPVTAVFCLAGGQKPIMVDVEPDLAFHAAIVEESERFMEMVKQLEPPAPDGKPGATRALHRLYPREDGSIVGLPKDALEWTREYMAAGAARSQAERRQRHFQQLLKHAMGKATYGVLPEPVNGKSTWRWATQPRPAYEVEAGESRVLLPLKHPPEGAPVGAALPQATDTLVEQLAESVEREALPRIRFGNTRKRRNR